VGEIISFLFAPAKDSCQIEQSAILRFFLVHFLPLRDIVLPRSIGAAASHHSILQDSCLMPKEPLTLCTLCANVKAHLRLMNC
jgi:hypothetical protein